MDSDAAEELLSVEAELQEVQGKTQIKLEICIEELLEKTTVPKASKRSRISVLETKLDDLRKELSSTHGGIFPHAVLSAQHIGMLSKEKPTSVSELEKLIGKLKTDKYGCRIVELIQQYAEKAQPNGDAPNAAEANEDRENKGTPDSSENRDNKRRRKSKAAVLIESSKDE